MDPSSASDAKVPRNWHLAAWWKNQFGVDWVILMDKMKLNGETCIVKEICQIWGKVHDMIVLL